MTDPKRVVIVGAGLAGGNAAVTLRTEGFGGDITLLGDEPEVPYGRPPLSKSYLQGGRSLGGWYVRPRDWYERNDVDLRTDARVLRVDAAARQVLLESGGRVAYDRLILCTGGRARMPELAGIDLPGVHLLRTRVDCDAIKREAHAGASAVVVGMGFIGCEVAASLRRLDLRVTAVLGASAPLVAVLGDQVGAAIAGLHRDHGVELIPGDRVAAFLGRSRVEAAVTEHGRRIECDLAVVGAGIELNVEPLAASGIALDNGILVDPRCRTNMVDVFAAGDVANHLHPLFGRLRVEHYNNAEKMGAAAARSALGDATPYAYVHTFWSDQYDEKIEYAGYAKRWDEFVVRGETDERRFVGFYIEGGVLRAAIGLNRGGDPELDEGSEMHQCVDLIAQQARVSADRLRDESVPLTSAVE